MTDRNKILEMIAKASRLTEDAGAFQGEASAAAAKIQELMEKYAISQMDIQNYIADKQEKEFKESFESVQSEFQHNNVQEWEWSLARLIADITMTRNYASGIGSHRRYNGKYYAKMVFFGAKENAEAAAELYALWHENIERMAEQARRENLKSLKRKYGKMKKLRHFIQDNFPEDDPKYFRASWIRGCLNAMHNKVYEERKAREQERETSKEGSTGSQNAIILYKAEVDKAYTEMAKYGFKKVKTKGSRGFSSEGYRRGQETGSKIRIGSKQLED
jgi:hypothetical protein